MPTINRWTKMKSTQGAFVQNNWVVLDGPRDVYAVVAQQTNHRLQCRNRAGQQPRLALNHPLDVHTQTLQVCRHGIHPLRRVPLQRGVTVHHLLDVYVEMLEGMGPDSNRHKLQATQPA